MWQCLVSNDLYNFTFDVHGAVLSFSTNSYKFMQEARKDFGSYETQTDVESEGNMRIIETDKKFPLKIPEYAIRYAFLQGASISTIDDQLFLEEEEKRILKVDFKKNQILGYFNPNWEFSMLFPLRYLLKWMLIKTLERSGIAYIHGSGVEKNGLSKLFIGPSGHGKTHTLVTLLLQDHKLVTDDTIFLKNKTVLPFYTRSTISKNMLNKFPILKKGLNDKSTFIPGTGWFINIGSIFPIQKKVVQPSKLYYIYVWNAEETKIEMVSKKEMLSRLLHVYQSELDNSIWFNYKKDEAMKNIFANYHTLVENADCYKIYAGSDPSDLLKKIQMTEDED